jgi:hypothetical protein
MDVCLCECAMVAKKKMRRVVNDGAEKKKS